MNPIISSKISSKIKLCPINTKIHYPKIKKKQQCSREKKSIFIALIHLSELYVIGIDLLFNLSNVLIAVPMYIDEVRFLENSHLEKFVLL